MSEIVRNVTFNPSWTRSLEILASRQAEEGFALVRVVPVHDFEAVAVLVRHDAAEPEPDEEEPERRSHDAFTARYVVDLDVADPHVGLWNHTAVSLLDWLGNVVGNHPRQGVKVSVELLDSNIDRRIQP